MTLALTDRDRALLGGDEGAGARMAMSIIVRMAQAQNAQRLLDVTRAHVDSAIYLGEAGLEFAERLAGIGARVCIPTTLNVSGLDEQHWREWSVPALWADNARRQMQAYVAMGCEPTWTCAPYQTSSAPRLGEQIAWGESNAVVFANSVLGARTERYPDFLDICAAVTGRVPAVGLHLTENRAGQIRLRLRGVPPELQQDDTFYPVLGFLLGRLAGELVPVLEGLETPPSEDELKALGAAAASSGNVALFHIVGVTPEARTGSEAFQGRVPLAEVVVGVEELRVARRELDSHEGEALDLVVLGSPHFSLEEFDRLARLVAGRTRHPRVTFLVTTSRAVAALAERKGALESLRAFGGRVTVDTCILATPMLPPETSMLMTNSGKYAYYAPGMLKARVAFGGLKDCVRSAVEGRVVREDALWVASAT